METKITNIILVRDKFQIFATIDGNEETTVLAHNATAQDIKDWVTERVTFYNDLKDKESELRAALINRDLQLRGNN